MLTILLYTLAGMFTVCVGAFILFLLLEFIAYIILYGRDGYDE